MRNKGAIAELTEKALTVTFPTYNQDFERFRHKLAGVVEENFGGEEFNWDETNQRFYWEEWDTIALRDLQWEADAQLIPASIIRIKRSYHIDPKLNLADQFTKIEKEQEAFHAYCIEARKALREIK
jgi:hypothetical protein